MRAHFVEGDVVVCEVQAIHHDGSLALHTRSLRYGKLGGGSLIQLNAALIARAPSAFAELDGGDGDLLTVIVGVNGTIWVGPTLPHSPDDISGAEDEEAVMARLAARNAALLLSAGCRPSLRRKVEPLSFFVFHTNHRF